MHHIVGTFGTQQEVYSIDESFIELPRTGEIEDFAEIGQQIKQRVWQWLTLPVAVGIGLSKTQAKLANHLAKKQSQFQGVLDFTALTPLSQQTLLQQTAIGEIWGIGCQLETRLKADGLTTAWHLHQADPTSLQRKYSIIVAKIARELRGQPCLDLETLRPPRQQIVSSRSFKAPLYQWEALMNAVARYTAMAAEKLRSQNSVCQQLSISIRTSPFDEQTPYYHPTATLPLIYPSDNTILLTKLTRRALKQIFKPGLAYKKATVWLSEIQPKGALQTDLFAPHPKFSGNPKADQLMQTLDKINKKHGRHSLQTASGLSKKKPNLLTKPPKNPKIPSPGHCEFFAFV